MKFKLIKMLVLLGMFGTGSVYAQSPSQVKELQEIRTNENFYKEKLGLTDAQNEKVKVINGEYFNSLMVLKKKNASRISKFKEFKSLNENRDKKMKDVLDKDQYQVFETMQKEFKNDLKQRRKK